MSATDTTEEQMAREVMDRLLMTTFEYRVFSALTDRPYTVIDIIDILALKGAKSSYTEVLSALKALEGMRKITQREHGFLQMWKRAAA